MERKEISENWMRNYNLAKKYYEEHGNLLIPQNYEVVDNGNIIKLGNWINKQRAYYNENAPTKLTNKQIGLLNEIKMVWNLREYNWFHNRITRKNLLGAKKVLIGKLKQILDENDKDYKFNSKDDVDKINMMLYDKIA